MGSRPAHLNLRDDDANMPSRPPRANFYMELPSPRMGEFPPALSPLDAFAMQSRILAKRFEQEAQDGKRISRLPYNAVAHEFANRPDFFRSVSGGSDARASDRQPEMQEETRPPTTSRPRPDLDMERPISHYPMMGHARTRSDRGPAVETPYFDAQEVPMTTEAQDYFGIGIPRSSSPEPTDSTFKVAPPSPMVPSLTNSVDSVSSASYPRTLTNGSPRSQRSLRSDRGLVPPKSPAFLNSPRSAQSIRSVRQDSGDDETAAYNVASPALPSSRKFPAGSKMSRPRSPPSLYMHPAYRSSSATSDISTNGSQTLPLQRPPTNNFNFSRPLSSRGRPVDAQPALPDRSFSSETRDPDYMRLRHPSASSSGTHPSSPSANPSRQNSADDAQPTERVRTPPPTDHARTTDDAAESGVAAHSSSHDPAPSYTYTKYALPRGRTVERESLGHRTSWLPQDFDWEGRKPPPPPSPTNEQGTSEGQVNAASVVTPRQPVPTSAGLGRISGARLSCRDLTAVDVSADRSRAADFHLEDLRPKDSAPSVHTASTDRTIKAAPLHERSASTELTPQEHLEVGIQAHTAGHLSKSTYHLRLAARASLPTAMLLYALACRHGWGMRANQEEGVEWLRKAIEGSGLEVVDVEAQVSAASARTPKADPVAEAAERRKRKAQFALAIYELGISYMNGWGCPKEKPLAVRCFEVAGNWGDCDALAEAGYCYTQGVGCRKDLKKAAALYRKAADGGMSMAGNSW